jgi:hypothetical protein
VSAPHVALVEQREQLKRVREKLDLLVLDFCQRRRGTAQALVEAPDFHGDDLLRFVRQRIPDVAPDSPRRVLAQLRREGWVNYEVVDRRASLYRLLPVTTEAKPGRSLVNELRAELAAANRQLEAAHARLRELGAEQ